MKIAVVGSGISGLVAADRLSRAHDVIVFESESRLGGHTHTVDVSLGGQPSFAVDTGFIVFNARTYPRFVNWLTRLGVGWQPSDMSFSVRSDRRDFEYSSASINALFSQRRHLWSSRFHRLWRDILRFYRESPRLIDDGAGPTLGEYVDANNYSTGFVEDHLVPLVGAVWSADRSAVRRMPARLFVRFFHQHGFLQRGPGWQWLTVRGGAREYIRAWERQFRGSIRLASPVSSVERQRSGGVMVSTAEAGPERFDQVVLACHADTARALVTAPTPLEADTLSAFRFQPNDVALHTDSSLMPRLRRTWASWNAHLDDAGAQGPCVTYWMNRLQSLPTTTPVLVTLNRTSHIRPERMLRRFNYAHPLFTREAEEAQAKHASLILHDGLSYCGAYWRNGFHEDGVVSAERVAERFGIDA